MKKFFDKIRRWLIKKLGGYTEQFPPIQPIEFKTYNRQVERLCWECSVPAEVYGSETTLRDYMLREIEQRAMAELTKKLFIEGFVLVQTEPLGPSFDLRRRYTILVARP